MLLLLLRCSLMFNSFSVVVVFKETLSSTDSQQDAAANTPANTSANTGEAKTNSLDDYR